MKWLPLVRPKCPRPSLPPPFHPSTPHPLPGHPTLSTPRRIEPPATPPFRSSTSQPGLLTSNDRITISRGAERKSRCGTGIFLAMYSQMTSMLYLSWAEMGMTGAFSATVPARRATNKRSEWREERREGIRGRCATGQCTVSALVPVMGGPLRPRPQNRSGLLALHVCRRHGHPLCGCNHRDGQKLERRRQTGRLGQGVEDDRLWGEDASPRPIPVGPRHGGPLHQGGRSCGDDSRDAQPARRLAGSPRLLRPPTANV